MVTLNDRLIEEFTGTDANSEEVECLLSALGRARQWGDIVFTQRTVPRDDPNWNLKPRIKVVFSNRIPVPGAELQNILFTLQSYFVVELQLKPRPQLVISKL